MGIGDWLMASGEAYDRYVRTGKRTMFIHPNGRTIAEQIFRGNPGIAYERGEGVEFELQGGGVRPYIMAKRQDRWVWRDYCPKPAPLRLAIGEYEKRNDAIDVLIEPSIKAVGHRNKDWGEQNWLELVDDLHRRGLRVGQLVAGDTSAATIRRDLSGAGVVQVRTPTFLDAARVMAELADRGVVAVLPEGGLHHAAAGVGLRSIVLFGGFISPSSTGYRQQVNLFTGCYACGSRVDCQHCAAAMKRIRPGMVSEIVVSLSV